MTIRKQKPVHPGEILKEDFLKPLELSNYRLAKDLHIPAQRVGDIINGKRAITSDTALRLAEYFNTTPDLWMGLQMEYDLRCAAQQLAKKIKREVKRCTLIEKVA